MKSRYDRNQQLYEKVKNNDYDDYNQNVKDFELDFDAKDSRKGFHEKKRLSVYFQDIEHELESANTKLNSISDSTGLEIKKDVDLKSLIQQAKKNHREQGGNIFSNTQYEILSSLNVEESASGLDEEDKDLILEDIIGETIELNLENELVIDDNFGDSIVDLRIIDTDKVEEIEEFDDIDLISLENPQKIPIVEEEVTSLEEIEEEPVEEKHKENDDKKVSKIDEVEIEEKSEKWITILLVFLIISLIVVGLVVLSQYIGGF
ncbi:MAG: hypothetical protein ACK5K7_00515 [Bacilli bacterium]